ncbi:MAG: hypothetical protein HYT35_01555 [Candidatus Staskawiczbacteria bacterium]|nr:hypothetical protein [Candidatus Staskawiczbacteria bacterium]
MNKQKGSFLLKIIILVFTVVLLLWLYLIYSALLPRYLVEQQQKHEVFTQQNQSLLSEFGDLVQSLRKKSPSLEEVSQPRNGIAVTPVRPAPTSTPTPTPTPTPTSSSCQADTWSCSDWSSCSTTSGTRTRACAIVSNCPSVNTPSPETSQSCAALEQPLQPDQNSCQADTWSCGNWSSCSASGSQTRTCTKTFDCPLIDTQSPIISQNCSLAPTLAAVSQSVTIDPKDMIGIMYNVGTSSPPQVYDIGNPNDIYDDVSNRRIGYGATGGWTSVINRFKNDIAGGAKFLELDAPFGRHGYYTATDGTTKAKIEAFQLSAWTELNTIYRDWYMAQNNGQEPPILATWGLWKEFNETYPNITVQVHVGSPHNDYELNKLSDKLSQEYWDYLWSLFKPLFEVGFRDFTLDNSAGNGANHVATKRALEVLSNPSKRDCNGLDSGLCGAGGLIGKYEIVNVRVEAKPRLENDPYQLQLNYWIREDTLQNQQNSVKNPASFGPDDLYRDRATRFIRFYNGSDDLIQKISKVLNEGDIALISPPDINDIGLTDMNDLLNYLNITSIPRDIDLRSGNANEENMTYIITNPPSGGQLEVNPYYPYIYKFTPSSGFSGIATFRYKITSGTLTSNEATVTINVKPIHSGSVSLLDIFLAALNLVGSFIVNLLKLR